MPLLGDEGHKEMVHCLQDIAADLRRPSAIVVVSAHWEEDLPTITANANPPLIYDYYGFPEESYSIEYPCPGEPLLAAHIRDALEGAGVAAKLDGNRGLDHGVFVPLKIMYPNADIPCVQLSLVNSLGPSEHIKIGRALQGLDYPDLLVIGSGSSFHNVRAFVGHEAAEANARNASFEKWLVATCCSEDIDEAERTQRLIEWPNAPGGRFCHPREEHLLPLHVCYGVANAPCSVCYELQMLGKTLSMYLWLA